MEKVSFYMWARHATAPCREFRPPRGARSGSTPMIILVTGGTGYLGSQLIRDLPTTPAFRGATIRVLDNQFRERYVSLWDLPAGVPYEFLEGDIRNEPAL